MLVTVFTTLYLFAMSSSSNMNQIFFDQLSSNLAASNGLRPDEVVLHREFQTTASGSLISPGLFVCAPNAAWSATSTVAMPLSSSNPLKAVRLSLSANSVSALGVAGSFSIQIFDDDGVTALSAASPVAAVVLATQQLASATAVLNAVRSPNNAFLVRVSSAAAININNLIVSVHGIVA